MNKIRLTRSTALSPAFEGGHGKRRSELALSNPRHLCRGVEGLTFKFENVRGMNPALFSGVFDSTERIC